MRDTIFISHANPENNYFAAWLGTKLKLLGYKVWVDVKDINPGQYFNRDFERVIKDETIRFLAVVSNDYITKSKQDDTGVMNEILCARTVKGIDGFIIPIRYDNSDYSEFTVGLRGRQAISFNDNWAVGLHELVKYFEELDIYKGQVEDNIIQFWHEAQKIKPEAIDKTEKYLTNWFPAKLPEYIYVHQPDAFLDSKFSLMPYTYIKEADRLITFVSKKTIEGYTTLNSSYQIETSKLFNPESIPFDDTFTLIEPNKKIVKLLNKIFRSYLIRNGLRIYEQANRKEIFYYPYTLENAKMISLIKLGKSRRTIMGRNSEFTSFFAISHSASLFPSPTFRIYYHLVFTDNNGVLLNTEAQHAYRRTVPSGWFNRKWLETLLAMMVKVSNFDTQKKIRIQVDDKDSVIVDVLPIDIISSVGYNESNDGIEVEVL